MDRTHTRKMRYIGFLSIAVALAGMLWRTGNGVMIGQRQSQNDINYEFGFWTPETRFEQSFWAVQENLCRVDFRLDSYHPWSSPYLELRLLEIQTAQAPYDTAYAELHQNSKEVRHKRINGWLLSPHMFNSFRFEPIVNSQGKQYLLSIQSPALTHGGSSIIRASSRKRLETEAFFVDGKKEERDLAFRVLYRSPRTVLLREAVQRLSLDKPFPFSLPTLYYVLLLLYLFLLFLFVWRLCRLSFSGKS